MKHSIAGALGKSISNFSMYGKKYGAEWWILVTGAVIILAIILMAIFAKFIAPFDPYDQEAGPQLAPPGGTHLLGTDNLQRDVFSRVVFGAQTILGIAVLAAIISFGVGVPLGLISGFTGGLFDKIISLIYKAFLFIQGRFH